MVMMMVFRARVFMFLLAGHVQLLCQPNYLLLDEREVQSVFQPNILFPPDCCEKVSQIYLGKYQEMLEERGADISRYQQSAESQSEKVDHLNFPGIEPGQSLPCKPHHTCQTFPILLRAKDLNTERMTRATNTEK